MNRSRVFVGLLLAGAVLAAAGCGGKKLYPDPLPGRHSADYHYIFGRLGRLAAKDPGDPPLWYIRYGYNDSDNYGGKLNLTPPAKLTGYRGGELIQVTGRPRPDLQHPEFTGTWYDIESIRLWVNENPQ